MRTCSQRLKAGRRQVRRSAQLAVLLTLAGCLQAANFMDHFVWVVLLPLVVLMLEALVCVSRAVGC
jgi:hypothetical protein